MTEWTEDGRPARWVTTTEPEWDDEQEGWLLALAWIRARTCPSCGLDVEVCGARQNDGRFQAEARRCHATAARARVAGQFKSDPYPESLLYSVKLP